MKTGGAGRADMRGSTFRCVATVGLLAAAGVGAYQSLQAEPAATGEAARRDVYFVPFSHLDFFWGGTREECLARGNRIIAKAVRLAGQHPEFRFLIEDEDFVANYLESHAGSAEAADLKRLVKEGRIEVAPKWAAIFQNLPNGEVLSRNHVYGVRYARAAFGVDPLVAHMGDIPGFIPQYPQILRRAGVPFAVMTRMGPPDRSLFYWKAPDGSRILTWQAVKGYGWGSSVGLHKTLTPEIEKKLDQDLRDVEATTGGPIFMHWGTDLWAPTEALVTNVGLLNGRGSSRRFLFATPTDFFRRVEAAAGLPEVSGEVPISWPNIVSTLAHMWPLAIPATNTLSAAETFATLNDALGYAPYPRERLDFLWKKLIESMDHNHDGQGGARGDSRKIEYSRLSLEEGGEILRDSLRNISERVELPFPKSAPVVVFNSQSWPRTDLVKAHVALFGDVAPSAIDDYRKGMRLLDEKGQAIPFHVEEHSENISRALEIVFVARDVPPLGYRTYSLVPDEQAGGFPNTARVALDAENDRKEPRRPLGSDVLESDFYRVTVDKATGRITVFDKALNRDVAQGLEAVAVEERGGNYIFVEPDTGRTLVNSVSGIELVENNGVRAVLRIDGQIADLPVTQRLILYKDLKRVDVEDTVDWKPGRFLRLEQLFPLPQPDMAIRYGVPFGSAGPGDLMPGSGPRMRDEVPKEIWMRMRHIHDWIAAGAADWSLTLAVDHQMVRLGDGVIRADMLRGNRFTSVKVARGDEMTSLLYPPAGVYTFRYSLSSGPGDWKAARSYRSGLAFNNPLIPIGVSDEISRKTLPSTRSFCSVSGDGLVVSALKRADVGPGVVLRVYEIQGAPVTTGIEFLGRKVSFQEVNLLEEKPSVRSDVLKVEPYEIKTVRIGISPGRE
jgi:hypothetical protein